MEQYTDLGSKISKKTIYTRTTLDERIFAVTGGTELLAITLLPRLLPLSYQTIKNQISLNRFALDVIRFNNRNYVRTEDVARLIENSIETKTSIQKTRGRKSNRERLANHLLSSGENL